MNIFIFIVVFAVFIYTVGFSISLWKDMNKIGSIMVFILALVVIIVPFFTIIK
ncbi:hypothetical protein [Fredinandcohnia quinoae]|uniref:Uncharacterized protein n=1 Tax=Fredinandcohnia quinoae TaxID=2918902 RepID=A0AAW5E7A5_9BACI|nr:hypothetical protein [Fredinandcohnia sp. SECRCQ15]MCH1627374.1 hypothetical protein [Fredinandcohnia sp. SECRCQ15]